MSIQPLREICCATQRRHLSTMRQRIAAGIGHQGFGVFLPQFFSIGPRDTKQLLLCELKNEREIFLPTSHGKNTPLVVLVKKKQNQFLAEVYSRDNWNKYVKIWKMGGSIPKEEKEVFLVKKGARIYYEGEEISLEQKSDRKEYPGPELTSWDRADIRLYQSGQHRKWLSEKVTPSLMSAMKTGKEGRLLLCSYKGEQVELSLGSDFAEKKAFPFYPRSKDHRINVKIEDLLWKFSLRHDGVKWVVKTLSAPH